MKHLWLYLFPILLSIFSHSNTVNPTISSPIIGLKAQLVEHSEGFLCDATILTSHGLKKIQEIEIGDEICLTSNNKSTIQHITHQETTEYVQISVGELTLNAGCFQKFYLAHQDIWIYAQDLKKDDLILCADGQSERITGIQKISGEVLLYKLSTDSQKIIVSENRIIAHNADFALTPITIGLIGTVNPVLATIGATLTLSAGALLVYQKLFNERYFDQSQEAHIDISQYEKQYYEERKDKLIKLSKDIESIKNGLLTLKGISTKSFTSAFFKNIPQTSFKTHHIAINESKLNAIQKESLRKTREDELLKLENEINLQQAQICFHFSELVERLEQAVKNYTNNKTENPLIQDWKQNLKKIPINTAYSLFEETIRISIALEEIEFKRNELHIAINYYKSIPKDSIIKKSTNIDRFIVEITKTLHQYDEYFKQEKKRIQYNKQVILQFLQSIHAPIAQIEQNLRNKVVAQLQETETQDLQRAQSNYQKIPHHKSNIGQGNTSNQLECPCGCCKCESFSCGCTCGCLCGNKEKERKVNKITKQEFFSNPVIKANYQHHRNGIYQLKTRGKPIVKNAEYLQWDHLHNDVEVYSDSEIHLGSLDPKTMNLYKPPVRNRRFPD